MLQELTAKEAGAFLRNMTSAYLGFYDGIMSNVIPVKFFYAGDMLFVHTAHSKMIKRLQKNMSICMNIEGSTDAGEKSNISVWGTYEGTSRRHAGAMKERLLHKIKVSFITGWCEKNVLEESMPALKLFPETKGNVTISEVLS